MDTVPYSTLLHITPHSTAPLPTMHTLHHSAALCPSCSVCHVLFITCFSVAALLRPCSAAPVLHSCTTPTLTPRLIARSPPPPQCSAPLPKRTHQPPGGRPRIRECSSSLRVLGCPASRSCWDRALVKVKYGIIGAGAVSDFHRKPARSLLLLLPLALLRLRPYGAGCSQMCPASTSTLARSW